MNNFHMFKPVCLLLALLIIASLLPGQYDEKNILTQQAYQLMAQRKYAEAQKLFEEILQQFPDDANSVLQLLNIYFQTSQLDNAEALLKSHRRILPEKQATEQEILLLIMQGRQNDAWKLSESHLQRQNYSENTYRLLAAYFERRGFYDQVLQLYKDAREQLGKPDLFRLETANAAMNYKLFDQALNEYLAYLEKNSSNLYFINNQCQTILMEDPTRIGVIGEYAKNSDSTIIQELYANALVTQEQYASALEVYKSLPVEKLVGFANQQYKELNDEIALSSFQYLEQTASEPVDRNKYRLRQATIHYRNGRYPQTKLLLEEVIADTIMLESRNLHRKGINLKARKLMAENSLALSRDVGQAKKWLVQAKDFCTNSFDTQDIDLALVSLRMIQEDYSTALEDLGSITEEKHRETRDYYRFSIELLRGNTDLADSLMNEYIIHHPAGRYVNDAIYQMMFTYSLEDPLREDFFQAWRQMLLQDPAAVDTLKDIFDQTEDEELLTLAIEWAILLADHTRAAELLKHEWQDPVSAEYASLLELILTRNSSAEQRLAREFLKSNPNSIFAPKFRQSLSRLNENRPDF
jgi:tetratricopeptide (TPR) repeat protein